MCCVAHENVEAAECLQGALDRLSARPRAREIAFDDQALPTFSFDNAARLVGITPFGGKRRDRDIGALARVQRRDGAADAGIASGDQSDFVFELTRRFVSRRLIFRSRFHVGFDAWLAEFLFRERRLRFRLDLWLGHADGGSNF